MFVLEAIMYDMDMSIQQFDEIYTEAPCRMYKVKVADRTKFKVTEDESRLTFPTELQDDIDTALTKVKNGKAFVRASGTEDYIRLYSEAETLEEMESMAEELLAVIEEKYKNI
jgi:phosphoacetylglucosamine mutase